MFHGVASNESSCSSKASLTMNSNRPLCAFRKLDKLMHNFKRRYTSIWKVKFLMIYAIILEMDGVISLVI
jgi:hypothetical protein